MSASATAGIADPYWYEWSVGLSYIIDMLEPETTVLSVSLQKEGTKGLDDVVVRYLDRCLYIQVKHTRADDTLTFGDLVVAEPSGGSSLLARMAAGWQAGVAEENLPCDALLFSNRSAGERQTTVEKGGTKVIRPPLRLFLDAVAAEAARVTALAEIELPASMHSAWTLEWLPELACLATDETRLEFLRRFSVRDGAPDLAQIAVELDTRLKDLFGVPIETATHLRERLDSALRGWSTTRRDQPSVTPEAAYDAIALAKETQIGEHELAPPSPFFESRQKVLVQIRQALDDRVAPVVFLGASPGAGKSAIISELTMGVGRCLDLRYFAYRPITPENQLLPADSGETTKARSLWTDLLLQARRAAKREGCLSAVRVPVSTLSLSTDDVRKEVLRVISELGRRRGRPYVVAIDGIDHAARAGAAVDSFISTLVPPSAVPDFVTFLIAGQPPESYANYPSWLRVPTEGVARIELPPLEKSDAYALVASKVPALEAAALDAVASEIHQHCQGNTLSTVFAVEEARLLGGDANLLADTLARRGISRGVDEYYSNIWASLASPLGLGPGDQLRLAACLSLTPMRCSVSMLSAVVPTSANAIVRWEDILRHLRPILVEEDLTYRVFHNDVRVFLRRLIASDQPIYRECAGAIADYLMESGPVEAKQESVHSLLGVACRWTDQVRLFTTRWVMESRSIQRALATVADEGLSSCRALARIPPNWDAALELACGLQTLAQAERSIESGDVPNPPRRWLNPPTRPIERAVPHSSEWAHEVVENAIREISDLAKCGAGERATAAFRRWFAGVSPGELRRRVNAAGRTSVRIGDEKSLEESLGRLSVEIVDLRSVPATVIDDESDGAEAEALFARGLLLTGSQAPVGTFRQCLRRIRHFYPQDVYAVLVHAVRSRSWRLGHALLHARPGLCEASWPIRIMAAGVAVGLNRPWFHEQWIAPVLAQRNIAIAEAVEYANSGGDYSGGGGPTVMAVLALVIGHQDWACDPGDVRLAIDAAYRQTNRDPRTDESVSHALYASALLGSHLPNWQRASEGLHLTPERLRDTAATLMHDGRGRGAVAFGIPHINSDLMDCYSSLSRSGTQPELSTILKDLFSTEMTQRNELGVFLETAWTHLKAHGQVPLLREYGSHNVGEGGTLWQGSVSDQHSCLTRLEPLLEQIGENAMLERARQLVAWQSISYSSHKEYVLGLPLEWFRAVARLDLDAWRTIGVRFVNLSNHVHGDNRFSQEIERAVIAAATLAGAPALQQLMQAPELSEATCESLLDGMMEAIATKGLPPRDSEALWIFGTASLCWRRRDDRTALWRLRDTLVQSSEMTDSVQIEDRLRSIAPTDYQSIPVYKPSAPVEFQDPPEWAPAVAEAISNSRQHGWSKLVHLLERVAETEPADTTEVRQVAWDHLKAVDTPYSWLWEGPRGRGHVFRLLFPYQSQEARWEMVNCVIGNSPQSPPIAAVSFLGEALMLLCLAQSETTGGNAVGTGLAHILGMHEDWISGAGHLPSITRPIADAPIATTTWPDFFHAQILHLLEFDEQSYLQTALAGLYRLLHHAPQLLSSSVRLVESDASLLRRFLTIAEPVAMTLRDEAFNAWLDGLMKHGPLDVGLEAWLALEGWARATGATPPTWPARPRWVASRVRPIAPPLVVGTEDRRGLHISTKRASTALLGYLNAAVGDCEDIAAIFASSERERPPSQSPRPRLRPGRNVADYSVRREDEVDRLFHLVSNFERQGRFVGVPLVRLAQALRPPTDGFVLLKAARVYAGDIRWPSDDLLESAIESGGLEYLARITEADLPPGHHVLGATLTAYSAKSDVKVKVEKLIRLGDVLSPFRPPTVLSGRSGYQFYVDDLASSQGAEDQWWLTARVGGLFSLLDSTMELFPTPEWRYEFGWEPDPNDPNRWTRDQLAVAWLERITGPVREIDSLDGPHRYPLLTRWICTEEAWNRIVEQLGGEPFTHVEVDQAPFRTRD